MTHNNVRPTALSLLLVMVLATSACAAATQSASPTSSQGGSSPTPPSSAAATPAVPSTTPASSPAVSPSLEPSPSPQVVRITVGGSTLHATVQLPNGWEAFPYGAFRGSAEPPAGMGLFASLIDNTFKDPCLHVQRSPKVGPAVADAAAALGEIPNTTATKPSQTTLAGHTATYVEITIPASLPCATDQFYLWQDSPDGDWWVQGFNELFRVWILEVGGQRVAIASRSWPGTSAEAKVELQQVLDSIAFDGGY